MVNRLAKGALPPNFNVQSVAQSAVSKSATVFVNYLTAQYVWPSHRRAHQTLTPHNADNHNATVPATSPRARTRRPSSPRTSSTPSKSSNSTCSSTAPATS